MAKIDHDNDDDHDNGPANDNDPTKAVAVPSAGALTSLAALGAALNAVDTASVIGRSGLPMLQFKREGDGAWSVGQKKMVVENGSRWAVNPLTFKWGYICFSDSKKILGERLVPVTQDKPEETKLPDRGFPWSEEWAVNLKCIDGADAGIEVIYKPTTQGGIQAIAGLIDVVRDRLNDNQHGGKVSPIVLLEKDSYPHTQFGKVWTPILTIVDWMPHDGQPPAPKPTTPPTEQPRRRRVG
jgi:hypothetical protein